MSAVPPPRSRKVSPRAAALELAERDPVLARLVADAGMPSFPVPTETHFATLVRAITYQQLAGGAARAIHGRLITALGDDVAPERLLGLSDEAHSRRRPVGQQDRLAARPVRQGARRDRRARAAPAGAPERCGDRGAPHRACAASASGPPRSSSCSSYGAWTSGPRETSASGAATASPGTLRCRPPRSSTCLVSRITLIAASSPGTAGGLSTCMQRVPGQAPSRCER